MVKVALTYKGAPGTHFCTVQAAFHRTQDGPARQFNSRRCFELDRSGATHDTVVAAAESDSRSLLLSTVILDDDRAQTHTTRLRIR